MKTMKMAFIKTTLSEYFYPLTKFIEYLIVFFSPMSKKNQAVETNLKLKALEEQVRLLGVEMDRRFASLSRSQRPRIRRSQLMPEGHKLEKSANIEPQATPFLTKAMTGEKLSVTASDMGMASIEMIFRAIQAANQRPYIFAVNKGGALLSTYFAHKLQLHEKYLIKCDYRTDIERPYCHDIRDSIDGPIVIIDDIARSGKTISEVYKYLRGLYPKNTFYMFTLVKYNEAKFEGGLNVFSPWVSETAKVTFPWSHKNRTSDEFDSNYYFDEEGIDHVLELLKNNNSGYFIGDEKLSKLATSVH